MKSVIIRSLFVFFGLILVLAIIALVNNRPQQKPPPPSSPTTGTIKGSLSFPSESLPENMIVCAVNASSEKEYCTPDHDGLAYQLTVPEGEYYVYASLPEDPERKAYYSEFVTCGLLQSCPSHQSIRVTVKADQTVDKIDPGDWYVVK